MVWSSEPTHGLEKSFYQKAELFCSLLVAAHSQERPTAAVMPIQVQNTAGLVPASMGLPHHPHASSQPLPTMPGPAAHATAVNLGRAGMPLACATAASMTSSNITTTSLDTEPSGRTVGLVSGLPTSPDSASLACGNSSAAKPEKDNKVRPALCVSTSLWPLGSIQWKHSWCRQPSPSLGVVESSCLAWDSWIPILLCTNWLLQSVLESGRPQKIQPSQPLCWVIFLPLWLLFVIALLSLILAIEPVLLQVKKRKKYICMYRCMYTHTHISFIYKWAWTIDQKCEVWFYFFLLFDSSPLGWLLSFDLKF